MKIFYKLLRGVVFKYFKPQMVLGYRNNTFLCNTRVSNTTDIMGTHNLHLGDNVFIGHFNIIDASCGLTIEEGCQIANFVSILTHSSHISVRLYGKHYIKHNGKHVGYLQKKVYIGKYSFIGPHSVIMPGASIGKGSIVSAYSYVESGKYPDYAILKGNPATQVGDTRNIDKKYLEQYPDLMEYYNEWTNE